MPKTKKAKVKAKSKIKKKVAKKPSKKTVLKRKPSIKRKSKKVAPIPKGYHNLIAYLIVDDAAKAIEFYKKAFGAKQTLRMEQPSGKIGHAELKIGDSRIMLADEFPEMNARGAKSFGGSPVSMHLYIKNVDTVVARALSAGAKLIRPIENMFYGDRSAFIEDPHGHTWCISTHVEDVTPAQIRKRAMEIYGGK